MRKYEMVPLGRIPELRARPDADRIGYTMPDRMFGDARVTVYNSRSALLAFCKGRHHALVKTPTDRNMIVNPNAQTDR